MQRVACSKTKSSRLVQTLNATGVRETSIYSSTRYVISSILIYDAGAFFAKGYGNILNCPLCSTRWCLVCDTPFHEGQTCEGYQAEKVRKAEESKKGPEDALSRQQAEEEERQLAARCRQEEQALQETTQTCPSCKRRIFKTIGCDLMTCMSSLSAILTHCLLTGSIGRCGHQFCWSCSAPYSGPRGIRTIGNSAHKPSYRYHSDRLY